MTTRCKFAHLLYGEAFDLTLVESALCYSCRMVLYEAGATLPTVYRGHVDVPQGRADVFNLPYGLKMCPSVICGAFLDDLYISCDGGDGFEERAKLLFGVDAVATKTLKERIEESVEFAEALKVEIAKEDIVTETITDTIIKDFAIKHRLNRWVQR